MKKQNWTNMLLHTVLYFRKEEIDGLLMTAIKNQEENGAKSDEEEDAANGGDKDKDESDDAGSDFEAVRMIANQSEQLKIITTNSVTNGTVDLAKEVLKSALYDI